MKGNREIKETNLQLISLDFTKFQADCLVCNTKGNFSIDKCGYICRILNGLKYHALLRIKDDTSSHDIFAEFCNTVYSELLNDWIHIISTHSQQLDKIHHHVLTNNISKCSLKHCKLASRHCERDTDNNEMTSKSMDAKSLFYLDIMDTIHFYLLHLFDAGLRVKKHSEFADNTLSKKSTHIVKQLNDKFTITFAKKNTYHNESSWMDIMFSEVIVADKWNDTDINIFTTFLVDEEFDSDAVQQDVSDTKNSNVAMLLHFDHFLKIKQCALEGQLKSCSFSTGFIFYYWQYYKRISDGTTTQISETLIDHKNINDHNGYHIKDLYICKKYVNLQEEILQHITIDQYKNKILEKAHQYINTEKVKTIKAAGGHYLKLLHYNITKDTPISIDHLITIVTYCDFSKFCSKFSSTFRNITTNESLESIKKRNREFWWFSKTLREAVQFYGGSAGDGYWEGDEWIDKGIKGPFYCGMNVVLNIPEFSIRLSAPTSTSKQIQVAINFAKRNGMTIQVNNNGASGMEHLRLFDCSWISRYSEEDERLFMGGDRRIRIESIRIIKTKQNFEMFMRALYIFDCMINGSSWDFSTGIKIKSHDIEIITKFVKSRYTGFDSYVKDTYKLFCLNKTQIIINMNYLDRYFSAANHLLFDTLLSDQEYSVCSYADDGYVDSRNILNTLIFHLFQNVNDIVIYSTSNGWIGYSTYSFCLIKFLSNITEISSSWREIRIIAIHDENENSWIGQLWTSSYSQLIAKYDEKKLDICKQKQITKNTSGYSQDTIVIKKLIV
eukprot:32200_1